MRETFEIGISALLDAELGHAEVLEVVDGLVDDPELRDFYRRVRGLDVGLLSAGMAQPLPAAPPDLWERIERSVQLEAPKATVEAAGSRFGRAPAWMMACAAAAVVALAVWVGVVRTTPVHTVASESRDVVSIQLAANAGEMDDDRFVELTAELLRADRRYHRAMEQIVTAVNAGGPAAEGHMEGSLPLTDFENDIRPAGLRQVALGGDERIWD